MDLKIVSTNGVLYEGKALEVVVPTKDGEIGILPDHEVYAGVVKGGICKFKTKNTGDFIKDGEYNIISLGDGAVYTDGKKVDIAVSSANSSIEQSKEDLEDMKQKLEQEIEDIKAKGSLEDIEKALFKINKIDADLKLKK